KRADRASELARLTHDVQEATAAKLRDQDILEHSIQRIAHVHARIANGELATRVPLKQGEPDLLWTIAVPLNNLLTRYQQALYDAEHAKAYLAIITLLVEQVPSLQPQATIALSELRAKERQPMMPSTSMKG